MFLGHAATTDCVAAERIDRRIRFQRQLTVVGGIMMAAAATIRWTAQYCCVAILNNYCAACWWRKSSVYAKNAF